MKKTKILIVNTNDRGGAAKSCKRLHLALLDKGVQSKVLLKSKQNKWTESYQFQQIEIEHSFKHKFNRKIRRLAQELKLFKPRVVIDKNVEFIESRPEGLEMFSFPQSPFDITQSPLYQEADIINLHWVANFLDYESFFIKNSKPVVWTLHDMNPFTGGEHYLEKSLGIDETGKPLERKPSRGEIEISAANKEFKKQILSQQNQLTIVAPSKWLVEEAKNSELFKNFTVNYIPYGLSSQIFKSRNKVFSRDFFNIPLDKKVILFVADSLDNNRKGFGFLKAALNKVEREDLVLCAIGRTTSSHALKNLICLGVINDERLMSLAYSAADAFVIPSLMDNLPNTVLESLMCGTPVIGFPIGGIPDMVIHGENGLLTNEVSVNSLKDTLIDFLKKPEIFDRYKIREKAVSHYDEKIQAEKYKKLFSKLITEEF